MKEYKLAYLTNSYVVEALGNVEEEKLQTFLKKIEGIDFSGYNRQKLNSTKKVTESTIKTSDDIKNEFKRIISSKVIDLTSFMKFVYSDSELVSFEFLTLLNEFLNMFDYRLYFSYDLNEFGKVYRAIMLLGTREDRIEYNEISKALVGNAKIIKLLDHKELMNIEELEEKSKTYKFKNRFEN